jgi:hypothetical protein
VYKNGVKPIRRTRRHTRVVVRRLVVRYRKRRLLDFLLTQGIHHKGMLMDLSEGGMRVLVDHPFPAGTPLAIRLEMPDVHGGLPLEGDVKRCRSMQGSGRYELGILLEKNPSQAYLKALARLRKDPLLRQGVL